MTLFIVSSSNMPVKEQEIANFSKWPRMGLLSFFLVGICFIVPFAIGGVEDRSPVVESSNDPASLIEEDTDPKVVVPAYPKS